MVDHVAKIWNWPNSEIESLVEQTEKFNTVKFDDYNEDKSELSVGARLLKGINSVLSRTLVDNLAKVAPENIGHKIGQLRKEILLAGPGYDDAIQRCMVIANEDYKYAENSLQSAYYALAGLAKNLEKYTDEIEQRTSSKGKVNIAKEVAKQLESTRNDLTVEKTVFKDVFDTIQPFAEENWNADENQLKLKWENRLKILKIQDRLNNAFENNGKKFNHEVEELLEEIGTEFQLMARLGGENFNFNKQSSIKFKDMLRIGVTIVGIATSITMLFAAPPLGIIMTIGTVISAITNFLKSQKVKQQQRLANL